MDKIIVEGGKRLRGTIPISGAKNAALTLIPCALLTDEPLTLRNLPRLADIDGFQHLMNQFGVTTVIQGSRPEDFGRVMTLEATRITGTVAPYDLVRKMRTSILVLGPMLARMGQAKVSLPGGCAIGNRPIDLHLKAVAAFGAVIEIAAGYVAAHAPDGGVEAVLEIDEGVVSPEGLPDFLASDKHAGVLNQERQQPEGLVRQDRSDTVP